MKTMLKRRQGAAKTEYIIVAVLVAIFSIGVVTLFGDNIRALFAASDDSLAGETNVLVATKTADDPCHTNLKGQSTACGRSGSTDSGGGSGGDSGGLASSSGGSGGGGSLGSSSSALTSGSGGGHGGEGYASGKFGRVPARGSDGKPLSRSWGNENDSPEGNKKIGEVGVELASASSKEEAARFGNDNANLRLGALDANASLGAKYDRNEGALSAGGNASVRVTAAEGNLTGTVGDTSQNYGTASAQGRVLTAEANVDASLAASKEGVSAKVEAGVGAAVAEGKIEGEGGFRIPKWVPGLGGAQVYAGGELSGSVLSAEARANGTLSAGKDGFEFGAGAKVGALLAGAGFKIKVGIRFN